MNNLDYMKKYDYEQIVYFYDKETDLRGITCIHDTTLGPALGGTRLWDYINEDEATIDVLRLARGMTYKAAAAGLNLGGGKTVILGKAKKVKCEAYWRAFGRYVQSLNGRYITAEDVNTSTDDMEYVAMETDYVTGLKKTSGDPSPLTAYGAYWGIKACAYSVFGVDSLKDRVVAVQGLGHVGYYLCQYLHDEGAGLIVTDIDQERIDRVVKEFNAIPVSSDEIYGVTCDIYAPCALGATVNDETLPKFKCKIIAGAANNVLKEDRHGDELEALGIVYAPDYVINAGGLINVYQELIGYNRDEALSKTKKIYDRILDVISISKKESIPTYKAADRMAENRIEKIKNIRSNYIKR